MYQAGGKPSLAKFRARLGRIEEASHTGLRLAERWNPKGRNFVLQRELIQFFDYCDKESERLLETIRRR